MLFGEAIRVAMEDLGLSVVGVVTTGEEALVAVRRLRPDVVLMDLGLPDQSGLAVGKAILEEWPEAKVLALTALNDRAAVDEALRLGFRGYLTKDTPAAHFVNSVRSVIDGHIVLPHRLSPMGGRSQVENDAALLADQLTPRELEVIGLLVQGADGRTIAAKLHISVSTLHTHLRRCREKLGLPDIKALTVFAARHCYLEISVTQRALTSKRRHLR